MNTKNLTQIQRDVLVRLLMAAPGPLRSGYGANDISGATGNSLVGRGLATVVEQPRHTSVRGTYYALTTAGTEFARKLRS